jgi:hypothetical protein
MVGMLLFLFCLAGLCCAATQPPSLEESAREPVKYVGKEQTDKHFYHGGLRHTVGVHRHEAFRANRSNPPEGGMIGWTYNHAPMLAYWNGKFYLQYLSDLKEEHAPPGRTLIMTSKDGRRWSNPQVIFPPYVLPGIKGSFYDIGDVDIPAGTFSVMHQRMGFYVAPNGRLLTLGFYSFCPNQRTGPNHGQGLGRVVREIYKDSSFGLIYFLRYNRHSGWDETNTRYPFYKKSEDKDFIEACDALLNDKLMTLQWWEEDRSKDGFYTIQPDDLEPKALCFVHRPDGVVLGLWKRQLSALSPDEGRTWTKFAKSSTLKAYGSKVWAQRTEDGRYALVYNHSASRRNRFPLAVMTSDDCHRFDGLLCLHGELPPIRYQGIHKAIGLQYIRGIAEGNGDPPGNYMWITYSMNKEDIWVTRTQIPITGTVEEHIDQNFETAKTEADLELWNLHVPRWAPTSVVSDLQADDNKCLELRDEEPYDYALAERAFPESRKVTVKFRVMQQRVGHGLLEFEVHDRHGNRPMRLRFDPDWLSLDRAKVGPDPVPMTLGRWYDITLKLDCGSQSYDLAVDGKWVKKDVPFAEQVDTLERLVFRTGPWRGDVRPLIVDGVPATNGLYHEDLPGADLKMPLSIFLIDDIKTTN